MPTPRLHHVRTIATKVSSSLSLANLALLLTVLGSTATAQTYTAVNLGSLAGVQPTVAAAMNSSGQVVGYSYLSNASSHAFLYTAGTMIDLGTLPGDSSSYATGINASGEVTGFSVSPSGYGRAFFYSGGTMFDLNAGPGEPCCAIQATAISDSGQVVGPAVTLDAGGITFLYAAGYLTNLSGALSGASAINSTGQIAGYCHSDPQGFGHACLYTGGVAFDLGALPLGNVSEFVASGADGLNDNGQVVGWSGLLENPSHAFLYSAGNLLDLGTSDAGAAALGINNSGQVVGYLGTSAFLFSAGVTTYLDDIVNVPDQLAEAVAINDSGQIAVNGGTAHTF